MATSPLPQYKLGQPELGQLLRRFRNLPAGVARFLERKLPRVWRWVCRHEQRLIEAGLDLSSRLRNSGSESRRRHQRVSKAGLGASGFTNQHTCIPSKSSAAEQSNRVQMLVAIFAPVLGESGDEPASHPNLDSLREWRRFLEVADRYRSGIARLPLRIVKLRPPTLEQLRLTLNMGRPGDYAIVHIVGYTTIEGQLAMEQSNCRERLIHPEELADTMRGRGVQLAVLNFCQGQAFAEALLDAGVQAVITTRDEISDPEATLLAQELFVRLALGDSFGEAHSWACKSIAQAYQHSLLPPLDNEPVDNLERYGQKRSQNIILLGDGSARLPAPLQADGAASISIDPNEPPNNLPIPDEHFAGRGRELVLLSDWLEERRHRLVAITGLSGIGKTTLALRAAQRNRWRFQRIIYFSAQAVDGGRKPLALDDIYSGIEAVLGINGTISAQPTPDARRLQAIQIINARASLLVIDSIDFLKEQEQRDLAEFLQGINPDAGSMVMLTCCHENLPALLGSRLGVYYHLALQSFEPSDSVIFLGKMLKPPSDRRPHFDELEVWNKIPSSSIPQGDRDRVSELAFQAGIPDDRVLALERLAAAAHHHPLLLNLAVAELKEPGNDWNSVLASLKALNRSSAQDLVENKIGAMSQKLGKDSPWAQKLLQAMLVFSQGATPEALRFVWCGREVDDHSNEAQHFDEARRAARRSALLDYKAGRYALHGLVHEYFGKHLRPEPGVQQDHARAHAEYFRQFLRRNHRDYRALETEKRNLFSGMDWATETGDHRLVSEYALLLFDFLWVRGYWIEGRERMLRGAEAARAVGDARSEAQLRFYAGQLHRYQADYDEAQRQFQLCRKLEKHFKDFGLRCRVWTELGILSRYRCNYKRAKAYYRRCLKLGGEAPDQVRANVLHEIGVLLGLQGRFDEAKQYCEQARALEEQLNDRTMLASTLHQLSLLHLLCGENHKAQAYIDNALQIARDLDNQILKARIFSEYGILKYRQGNYPVAREFLRHGQELREQLGDRAGQSATYYFLGELALVEGKCETAEDLFGRGWKLAESLGNPYWHASNLYGLGLCSQMREYRDQARRHFDEALGLAEQLHMPLADKIRRSLEEL